MKTKEQQNYDKALKYLALCQALINVIDEEWKGNQLNKQKVKSITNQLVNELEKVISKLIPSNDFSEEALNVTEQFVDASNAMIQFYDLGVQLARLDDVKCQGFTTQLNILLKSYGLDVEM